MMSSKPGSAFPVLLQQYSPLFPSTSPRLPFRPMLSALVRSRCWS